MDLDERRRRDFTVTAQMIQYCISQLQLPSVSVFFICIAFI